jgi:hypothetical protein
VLSNITQENTEAQMQDIGELWESKISHYVEINITEGNIL